MDVKLLHQPDSAIAHVTLDAGEEIVAEAGSMIAMSGSINTSTTMRQGKNRGIMSGLKRMLVQESLFLSVFRSYNSGAEVFLAPSLMGDISVYEVTGNELIVQAGSYLANTKNIDLDIGFQGFKSFFSGENVLWLTVSGYGKVLLSSFGSIYEIPVDGEYIVDTGHIVAFEKSLSFSISKPGSSWLGAWLGGEGLICRFRGHGKVYCQTHNSTAFGSLIGSQLPPKQ